MLYFFIDTNIYLRTISQGKQGCEREYIDDLATLVGAGEVSLLVPEVVELEIEAKWRNFVNRLVDDIHKAIKKLTEDTWESEVDDVRLSGIRHFKAKTRQKKDAAKANHEAVRQLMAGASTIPLTSDILLAAKKRMIARKMPRTGNSSDQDCLIVESLMAYFAGRIGVSDELVFCSENHKDYAEESPQGSKQYALHPYFMKGLPPTKYSQTLEART